MAISSIDTTRVLAAAVAVIAVKVGWELLFSPLKAFPGPLLAKFTDLWRAVLTKLGNVDPKYKQWHKTWGSAVRVGPNAISLSDPDLIKVIYTTKNPWRKSDMYRPNDVIVNGQRIPNIFNTQDHAFHSKYSRPIGGFWTLSKVLELEPYIDQTLKKWTDKLASKFIDGSSAGTTCMMDVWLTYFSWDAAANWSFGEDYGFIDQEKDVGNIIRESTAGLKYFAPVSQIPWADDWLDKNPIVRIGPRPLVNGFMYTVSILMKYNKQVAEGIFKSKGPETFMEKYSGLKQVHPDFVDENQVINWLMLNVLAGGDSTAGSMRAVVYYLAKSPNKYAKLMAELDAAKLSMPAQYKDFSKLPYLDAVIRESMRINPAIGLMLERVVPDGGFELPDGRFIPAGTKVGLNPVVITRDTGVFGDNVETFDPDRWLRKKGESSDEFDRRFRRMAESTDLMFGAGNRVCMGKHMAKLEIYKVFATLYSMFDVKLANPNHEWKYFNAWFMYQTDIPMVLSHRTRA